MENGQLALGLELGSSYCRLILTLTLTITLFLTLIVQGKKLPMKCTLSI